MRRKACSAAACTASRLLPKCSRVRNRPCTNEFSQIDDALQALREGRIIIVVDDQDRENEGDFIAAADKVTPEMIEFMITHGRGQVCMPILPEVAARLHLGPMVERNTAPHQTPYTVPVDHKSCRTGISAEERAQDGAGDHRPRNRCPTIWPVPATCFRWWPRRAACSAAPGIPRRRLTWPDWPA